MISFTYFHIVIMINLYYVYIVLVCYIIILFLKCMMYDFVMTRDVVNKRKNAITNQY